MSLKSSIARWLAQISPIRRIAALITHHAPSEIDAFFVEPYATRVNTIRELHSLSTKMSRISDVFPNVPEATLEAEIRCAPRMADDLIVALVALLKPASFLQVGCWSMGELQTLVYEGYRGKLIATDFNAEYIEAIKARYKPRTAAEFDFRTLDLEAATIDHFADVNFISAIQVLANIQPEGMQRLAGVLRNSPSVRCVVIGDNMAWDSMNVDAKGETIRHPTVRNWIHNYARFARDAGFDFAALPDITMKSNNVPRGIFILTRDVAREHLQAAAGQACLRFIDRQQNIWRAA